MHDSKRQRGPRIHNGRVIRSLAKRTVTSNPGKSMVVIISIALCTFMFATLFTVGGSIVSKLTESTARQVGGTAAASLKYLTEEEYNLIRSDDKLKEVSEWIYVGEAVNEELLKLRTEVHWSDEVSAKKSFCYPDVGRLPKDTKEDEMAASSLVLNALGLDASSSEKYEKLLGQKIKLTIEGKDSKRIQKEFTITGIYTGDRVAMSQVVLVSKAFQEMSAPTPEYSYYDPDREMTGDDEYGRIDADIDFYIPFDTQGQLMEAIQRNGLPQNVQTGTNWSSVIGTMDFSTMGLILAMLVTIFIAGFLIINNVYRINVYADIRSYGLLKTIGVSARQLKSLVKWQSFYHSLPGIIIGIIGGILVGSMLLPTVMDNLVFSETANAKAAVNVWIILGAVLFSLFTVRLSIGRSVKMASKVSPVEAVSYTGQGQTGKRAKNARTRSFSPYHFALRNIGRDWKKAIFVVISLALSLVVLNSVYTLLGGFDEDKYVESFVKTDFSVSDATTDNPALSEHNYEGITDSFLTALRGQPGVSKIGNIYAEEYSYQELNDRDYKRFKKRLLDDDRADKWMRSDDYGKATGAKIYGMDDYAIERLPVISGSYDAEKFKSGKYIIVNEYSMDLNEYSMDLEDETIAYFLPGETITVNNDEGKRKDYIVMATVEIPYAMRIQSYVDMDVNYILPTEEFLSCFGDRAPMRTVFDSAPESEETIESWINEYTSTVEPALTYKSRAVYKNEFKSFTNMFRVVGGMLTMILGLIGILNLINVLVTSLLSRRLELAMLEAVGMTKRIQRKSICIEGSIYCVLSILTGLMLSVLASIVLVRPFGAELWYYTWKLTLVPIACVAPIMIIAAIFIPAFIYRQTMHATIVERLRMVEA